VAKTTPLKKVFQTSNEKTIRQLWTDLVVGQWFPVLKASAHAIDTDAFVTALTQLVKQAAIPRDFDGLVRSWYEKKFYGSV